VIWVLLKELLNYNFYIIQIDKPSAPMKITKFKLSDDISTIWLNKITPGKFCFKMAMGFNSFYPAKSKG